MAYHRKRAAIACNYCRHRKRRCDGKHPVCGLCAESGVGCEYPDVPSEMGTSADSHDTRQLLNRLTELEAQVKRQSEAMAAWDEQRRSHSHFPPHNESFFHTGSPSSDPHPPTSTSISMSMGTENINRARASNAYETRLGVGVDSDDTQDISLTIPIGHWTTTGSLLLLPQVKSLIGDYPENLFLQIESSRATSVQQTITKHITDTDHYLPDFHTGVTDTLISAFFTYVHPSFPVLDRDMLEPLYQEVLARGLHNDAKSALCLVVLALGKMAINMDESSSFEEQNDVPGLEYFAPAYRIATAEWGLCDDAVLILPLALVHAALYFQYMNLPLQAWKMVHLASINLQYSISSSKRGYPSHDTSTVSTRLYWACFIFERFVNIIDLHGCLQTLKRQMNSDTLAEFHVPRTGIESLVDKMQFPSFGMLADRNGLLFLAVCSIRRLLNRVHSTLYATTNRAGPVSSPYQLGASGGPLTSASIVAETNFEAVCTELLRQLNTWYDSLPEDIKPHLDNEAPQDLHDGWLRLRYWSAMHIIGRPFVIFVVMSPQKDNFPPHIIDYCKLCLDSCRKSIAMASHILSQRTQYTWMIIHAMLACTFMVGMASITPALQPLVPDTAELLGQFSVAIKPWASADSSAEMIAWFVQLIRQKLRLSAVTRVDLDK